MADLLPSNSSRLERALACSLDPDLPVTLRQLWNPQTCPLHLLPWLAWTFSVDEWDDKWPEHVKRATVQNSYDIHRYKGTPYAVKTALDTLSITTELREWWESGGSGIPGTVTLLAMINENIIDGNGLLTAEMLEQVTRIVNCTKRGSIHFDIELGLHLVEDLAFAGGGIMMGMLDREANGLPVLPEAVTQSVQVAAAPYVQAFASHGGKVQPIVPELVASEARLCAAGDQLIVYNVEMQPEL